jgi:acetyl esterase/lipase
MFLSRVASLALVGALFGWIGSQTAAAQDTKPPANPVFEVEKRKGIAYRTDSTADKERHQLDVYVPKGQKDFPVVLFVHGGAWKSGNKNLYAGFGEAFAKQGIGFVVCNYRLSPAVQHPAHIEDVACAFNWTCQNIGKFGGNADRLYVCGHSAGGHLVSLLATDPSYLRAHGRSPADIKGVVSISGVYRIVPTESVFQVAFGKNEEICKKASPLNHVSGNLPPFLIAYADDDYPHLAKMAEDMHAALQKANSPSELLICKKRNHISIITSFVSEEDALNKAFRQFIQDHK